jgi:hypothetical protein
MPLDYLGLQAEIHKFGESASAQHREFTQKLEACRLLFQQHAHEVKELQQLVEENAAQNQGLRCAKPVTDRLDFHAQAPTAPTGRTIVAADGSQINPDPHAELLFALVNVGVFTMEPGSGRAPATSATSALLYDETLQGTNGLIPEELIALLRDASEREVLAQVTRNLPAPVITLTDGPLELYHEPRQDPRFKSQFQQYLRALDELSLNEVITAGYVDRPRANLVVRLLELLVPAKEGDTQPRPFAGIPDSALFETFLQPGERSAVFALQSSSADEYEGKKALHFFYINCGRVHLPALARVEIPLWVAEDDAKLDTLHATLVEQSQQAGAAPYPYALLRAHEVAVVTNDDRRELIRMMERELMERGFAPARQSFKQMNKENLMRKSRI